MTLRIPTIVTRFTVSLSAAFVFALMVPPNGLAQGDPMIGTWKLNLAKSTYKPGPPPRSLTAVTVASGQGLTATVDGINAQGMPIHQVFTMICNGQPQSVTGAAAVDAMSCRRSDPYTQEFTNMKGGRATTSGTLVVSRDGRTTTVSTKGVSATGQQIDNVAVYDKQ